MKLRKTVQKHNKYIEYTKIMNGLLGLSVREREILSTLMAIQEEQVDSSELDIFSTPNRKRICKECNILINNIPKMFNKYKDKGIVIINEEGKASINRSLWPTEVDGALKVEFELNIE